MKGRELPKIYFEKQGPLSNLCLVHAINNLFGDVAYNEKGLDKICKSLSNELINPHKHFFGGDYDANVLMVAMKQLGFECVWLDSRNVEAICVDSIVQNKNRRGYIINQKTKSNSLKQFFKISDRHWIAVKYENDNYIKLDSKSQSKTGQVIEKIDQFLKNQINNQSHIFQVLMPPHKK